MADPDDLQTQLETAIEKKEAAERQMQEALDEIERAKYELEQVRSKADEGIARAQEAE